MKICFYFVFFAFSFTLCAQSQKEDSQALEQQINSLERNLKENRLDEMRDKVEGQEYMISDWRSYGEDVKELKNQNQDIKEIERQIQILKKQKEELLNTPTPHPSR